MIPNDSVNDKIFYEVMAFLKISLEMRSSMFICVNKEGVEGTQ